LIQTDFYYRILKVMKSKFVIIYSQEWMVKNLNVGTFSNGDSIPEVKSEVEWITASVNRFSVWCFFDNFAGNGIKYGKLYNWYAVCDPKKLATEGWHVTDDSEWEQLIILSGGAALAGIRLKSQNVWDWDCNGTKESNFNGLPGCYKKAENEQF
jgi:uncharacterized protein (TIGR02145 family)